MDDGTLLPTGHFSPAWVDFFIVLGAIVLVTLAALIWALAFHKGGRLYRHRHRHHRRKVRKRSEVIKELIQERQHHRRREHHPTNPTLAETGGLPPIRGEKPPPSQP
jgi:hypothetical protein